jgi:D-aminopeptidase
MNNRLTDIAGVRVGHADDAGLGSGVTAIIFDEPVVASIDVRGGGPATRDTQLLDPGNTVETIHGLTLSGGSAYGLDAGGGVMAWLAEQGRGFALGSAIVPLAPTAVVFDLLRVAALAVANAAGSVVVGDGPWFWAAPFELNGEFGGRGHPSSFTPAMHELKLKGRANATPIENTTLAVVITEAKLTKEQAKRLAIIASTGFARAIYPVHAPLDGDLVFAVSTGKKAIDLPSGMTELGMVAANVIARAIARGVYEATALPFPGSQPAWKDRFGR